MKTTHSLHTADARQLDFLADASVHLVVTSPPYPMIEMWDEVFGALHPPVAEALAREEGLAAFEAMHQVLDAVWAECFRVLVPGGFACINIGDATRTMAKQFRLFHNHARVVTAMTRLGFTVLPDILWRKPTNAPTKFMGSGMLPAGAYVTYEHEYVLIFRKGGKRVFGSAAERARRRRSAFFWEERNLWFSDVWSDLRGRDQFLSSGVTRTRSAAFPFALPARLIWMYSAYGDVVLDPFAGTGTTLAAALVAGRSSIGVEHAEGLEGPVAESLAAGLESGRSRIEARLEAHRRFVAERLAADKSLLHHNTPHDVPVMTRQETALELLAPLRMAETAPRCWVVELGPPESS